MIFNQVENIVASQRQTLLREICFPCASLATYIGRIFSSFYSLFFVVCSLPICPTFAPSGQPVQPPPSPNICLDKCFDPRCAERNSSQWCDGIVSCYWCQKNKDSIPLNKPYCASSERCFRGIESATKTNESKCDQTI